MHFIFFSRFYKGWIIAARYFIYFPIRNTNYWLYQDKGHSKRTPTNNVWTVMILYSSHVLMYVLASERQVSVWHVSTAPGINSGVPHVGQGWGEKQPPSSTTTPLWETIHPLVLSLVCEKALRLTRRALGLFNIPARWSWKAGNSEAPEQNEEKSLVPA